MSSSRDDILHTVRAQMRGDADHPSPWQSRRDFPDLAKRFTESLTRVHGEVLRADSLDAALAKLGELFDDLGAQRVVCNDEPPLNTAGMAARWPDRDWYIVGQSEGNLREFCASADVGISSAVAALAETGSIVIHSGPGLSRQATLLPPVHVALVPTSALVVDIIAWAKAREEPFPANVTIITGPSKTADIEQTLAIGVHGPKRFIVVLYDA